MNTRLRMNEWGHIKRNERSKNRVRTDTKRNERSSRSLGPRRINIGGRHEGLPGGTLIEPQSLSYAEQFSRKCDKCQRHAPLIRQPAEELNPVVGPWPFARWGMDIVRPLPTAVEGAIMTDNGTQFDNRKFRSYCEEKRIIQQFSSRSYPQGKRQAEKTNRTIFDCLKRRLEQRKGEWSKELPNVLWAYRTTKRKPTDQSPFSLAYGTKAVILTEIGLPTFRMFVVESNDNEQQLAHNIDMLEEQREAAALRLANYQNQATNYFNKRVRHRKFKIGGVASEVGPAQVENSAGELKPENPTTGPVLAIDDATSALGTMVPTDPEWVGP
ncbi:hypothetical protein L3X38_027342 [Prunus dulcis]|uniref:Integrase catalytic domain-containing protein n=1 Tax=Prunus dulcis TaxID=3755 RepID=A0AAD4VQ26_PRUDU|nr:hypothetical protein L3X38_027342 [Prunus dulcis]